MMSIIDKIEIGVGKVEFNDMNFINDLNLINCIDSLKEDLLQVSYPNNILLDVGWYPSFDINGRFHVRLIKDSDWDNIKYHSESRSIIELIIDINIAVSKVVIIKL